MSSTLRPGYARILLALVVVPGSEPQVYSWSRKRFAAGDFPPARGALAIFQSARDPQQDPRPGGDVLHRQPYKVQMFLMAGIGASPPFSWGWEWACSAAWSTAGRQTKAGRLCRRRGLRGVHSLVMAAYMPLTKTLRAQPQPVWGDFSALGTLFPAAGTAVDSLGSYLIEATIALWICSAVDRITGHWARKRWLGVLLLALIGFLLAGTRGVDTILSWLMAGLVLAAFLIVAYVQVVRYWLPLAAIAIGAASVLGIARAAPPQPISREHAGCGNRHRSRVRPSGSGRDGLRNPRLNRASGRSRERAAVTRGIPAAGEGNS